jgi:hypothetical protein
MVLIGFSTSWFRLSSERDAERVASLDSCMAPSPARLIAKKWRTFFAAVYMTSSQQALAPRSSSTLDTVHDMLGTLVAGYRTDEVLTCLRQIPARDAVFRPMPDWVSRELVEAYAGKEIRELYSHQAATTELVVKR